MNLAPQSLFCLLYYPANIAFLIQIIDPKERINLLLVRYEVIRYDDEDGTTTPDSESESPHQKLRANVPRRYFTTEHSLVVSNERFLAWAESWNYFLDLIQKSKLGVF